MSVWAKMIKNIAGFLYWASNIIEKFGYSLLTFRRRRRWNNEADQLLANNSAENIIPIHQCYCYNEEKLCDFWQRADDLPEMKSGYCSYLRVSDWDQSYDHLIWDQVKLCDINRGENE